MFRAPEIEGKEVPFQIEADNDDLQQGDYRRLMWRGGIVALRSHKGLGVAEKRCLVLHSMGLEPDISTSILGIAPHTVHNLVNAAHRQLGVHSSSQAIGTSFGRADIFHIEQYIMEPPTFFTEQDSDILEFLSEGFTHAEIGQKLYYSKYTIGDRVEKIRQNNNVHTTQEALMLYHMDWNSEHWANVSQRS